VSANKANEATDSLPSVPRPGYHLRAIARGRLGELSKIQEELDEAHDAWAQGSKVMALVELSDLVGALEAVLVKHFPGMTLTDLQHFAGITRRAFENGHRTVHPK
jgi:hypothetical protein